MARIILQTQDLAGAAKFTNEEREELLTICRGIAFRLVNARTVAEDIKKRSDEEFERLKAKWEPGAPVVEIPYLINLDILFEGYFYNAKNIIRDLGGITKMLFGRRFSEASDWCTRHKNTESEVSKFLRLKAKNAHAGYASIRELIEQSRSALEMIVRVRNALEHPGGYSGTVTIANFKTMKDGVRSPTFKFEGEVTDYDVALSMSEVHNVLLHLVETILVFGLMMRFQLPNMGVKHIKPEDRDPTAPKAWRVVLIPPHMMDKGKPFDGKPSSE
jgi:hypothetical protein